jgi:glyoxylase-like metal-dependent hydrolase (beta-lactamase superfamily II)
MVLNQNAAAQARIRARRDDPAGTEAQRQFYDRMAREAQAGAADFHGTYLVPPTETFIDHLTIDDPERPVQLMFLGRANTEGDAIAWLPRQRILMTGDIVVSPIPFGFGSYPESWIGVLQRLKALNFALLVPGHGEPMSDAAYLDRLIAAIGEIRAQVGPLARQGLTLEQVRQRVDLSAQTALFATTPRAGRLFDAYWLQPMVENAWKEARGVPILQGEGLPGPPAPPAPSHARRARR